MGSDAILQKTQMQKCELEQEQETGNSWKSCPEGKSLCEHFMHWKWKIWSCVYLVNPESRRKEPKTKKFYSQNLNLIIEKRRLILCPQMI